MEVIDRIERVLASMRQPCSTCEGEGAIWEECVEDNEYHGWWRVCADCDGTGAEGGDDG